MTLYPNPYSRMKFTKLAGGNWLCEFTDWPFKATYIKYKDYDWSLLEVKCLKENMHDLLDQGLSEYKTFGNLNEVGMKQKTDVM